MKKNDIENSALAFVMLGLDPVIVAKYKTDDGTYTVRIDKGRVDFHKPYRPGDSLPKYARLEDLPDDARLVQVEQIYRKSKAGLKKRGRKKESEA